MATSGANGIECHVTIADEITSSTGDSVINKHSDDETGHERLLRKTASVDGKAISHSRASRPPHYLYFALIAVKSRHNEITSSTGDSVINKHSNDETGHERLLRKTASVDGKAISHSRASRPPHYLYFALIVTICCKFPFGGVALVFSILSKRSGSKGDIKDAELLGNISKWLSIVGIAITAVVVGFSCRLLRAN